MKRGGRTWAIVAMLATGGALSLLIWAKLKIVASIPRSAYAEPEAKGQGQGAGPVQGAGDNKPSVEKAEPGQRPVDAAGPR